MLHFIVLEEVLDACGWITFQPHLKVNTDIQRVLEHLQDVIAGGRCKPTGEQTGMQILDFPSCLMLLAA